MSSNLNRVFLMGRLTRDCDVRQTKSGTCVVNVSLAVNRQVPKGEGKWEDETTFIDVAIWGQRGKAFADYHRKGSLCFIEGRLTLDEWEDRETGGRRTKLKVTAESWQFVGDEPRSKEEEEEEKF